MKTLQIYLSASKSGKRNGVIDMRLIDADALKTLFDDIKANHTDAFAISIESVKQLIDESQTVDIEKEKQLYFSAGYKVRDEEAELAERHGKWSVGDDYECSECECMSAEKTAYCGNCGAKMDGGAE